MTIALKTTFSRLILIVLTGILALLGFWGGVRIVNKIVLQNIGLAMRDADYAYVQKTLSRMPWLLRATDDCNNTLVQLAIESQNPKMVDLMLQLGAERDPTVAVFKDDASTLAQYIDSDRKLLNQTLSCDKYTLLHLSAKSGSTQSAMLLITKGATVDVLCRHEWTPLRYAVFHENDDVAGVLIDAGASRDIWIDAGLGDYNAVQVWLDTYPQLLNATDANGLTPLHWAAHRCRPEVAELLLEQGAEPNIRTDYIVGTPLMLATKARCADDVKRLLEKWDGRLE